MATDPPPSDDIEIRRTYTLDDIQKALEEKFNQAELISDKKSILSALVSKTHDNNTMPIDDKIQIFKMVIDLIKKQPEEMYNKVKLDKLPDNLEMARKSNKGYEESTRLLVEIIGALKTPQYGTLPSETQIPTEARYASIPSENPEKFKESLKILQLMESQNGITLTKLYDAFNLAIMYSGENKKNNKKAIKAASNVMKKLTKQAESNIKSNPAEIKSSLNILKDIAKTSRKMIKTCRIHLGNAAKTLIHPLEVVLNKALSLLNIFQKAPTTRADTEVGMSAGEINLVKIRAFTAAIQTINDDDINNNKKVENILEKHEDALILITSGNDSDSKLNSKTVIAAYNKLRSELPDGEKKNKDLNLPDDYKTKMDKALEIYQNKPQTSTPGAN